MALGNILSGRNGLVKVGGVESDNIESWSYNRSTSTTDISILNTTNDVTQAGSVVITGSIEFYYDPADATHVTMQSGGTATLELYMDGEATSDYYLTGDALFDGFDLTTSAADGTVKASSTFKATTTWSQTQVV